MVLSFAILFVIALTGYAQTSQKMSKDEAAIRANVEQMAKDWNTKSAAEFKKPFAENADYVPYNGLHTKNYPSNTSELQRLFETSE